MRKMVFWWQKIKTTSDGMADRCLGRKISSFVKSSKGIGKDERRRNGYVILHPLGRGRNSAMESWLKRA